VVITEHFKLFYFNFAKILYLDYCAAKLISGALTSTHVSAKYCFVCQRDFGVVVSDFKAATSAGLIK